MLEPGDRIGRYEIQRRLGRGGMGTVYVAHDPILGRMVAVKMFAGELDAADAAGRFAREARAAAALNHANIVTIHDFGEFSSEPFIVMEYVKGDTVARLIRTKAPWSLPERIRLMQELCAGVAYAHGFDVIHRDIKPANLMVDQSGRLKILDFGIARMLGNSMSRATALIGTPGYMAPEQILGSAVDRRSDIFSIGVVCYELLSYTEAFPGDSVPAITHRVMQEEPVSLTQLVPGIPTELVAIVEKALKKDAAGRFADAESFGAALAKVRRQFEGETEGETLAPTLPGGSRSPSRGTGRASGPGSGTGATKSTSRDSAALRAPTPASTPGRAAGEELKERKKKKVDAFLTDARQLAESGELDAALEACVEALMLDDTHAEALEVERVIRAAMSERVGATQAVRPDPVSETARLEGEALRRPDLHLGAGESHAASTPTAFPLRTVELSPVLPPVPAGVPTVVAPGVRPASPPPAKAGSGRGGKGVSPVPPRPRGPSAVAVAISGAWAALRAYSAQATGALVALATVTVPRLLGRATQAATGGTARVVASAKAGRGPAGSGPTSVRAATGRAPSRAWMIAAVGGIVLIVAAASVWFLTPTPPPPVGTVAISAVPWATIAAVVAEDGTAQALPSDASTPISLRLPVGTYRVTLAGPQSAMQEVRATVEDGKTATLPTVTFAAITAEDYFEPYLASRPVEMVLPGSQSAALPAAPAGVGVEEGR